MKEEQNFLSGNIWIQIITFALPIIATSMLQQLFNSADTAVVGRFASSEALAAVGSTSIVVSLCITLLTGLSVGANVRISHAIGRGDRANIKANVDSSLGIALVSGVIIMAIGEIFSRPLLEMLNTPENVIDAASDYLHIYFLGVIFLMVYNFTAAILRASGDSRKPLYCLLISGAVNVVFNLLFVVVFSMGVVGVALGTLIADIVNMILAFYFLLRGNGVVKFSFRQFHPERASCISILVIGIPAALQGMMFNIANLLIQSGFNSLGSQVVAANTIALNAEIFVYYLLTGFGQATVTFTGQNYGAGNVARCKKTVKAAVVMGEVATIILVSLFEFAAMPFASIFSTDSEVISIALERMRLVLYFQTFNLLIEVYSGALRGLGHSSLPTLISAVFICGTRIVWMLTVFPLHHTFRTLTLIYPVSWIITGVLMALVYYKTISHVKAARS